MQYQCPPYKNIQIHWFGSWPCWLWALASKWLTRLSRRLLYLDTLRELKTLHQLMWVVFWIWLLHFTIVVSWQHRFWPEKNYDLIDSGWQPFKVGAGKLYLFELFPCSCSSFYQWRFKKFVEAWPLDSFLPVLYPKPTISIFPHLWIRFLAKSSLNNRKKY